MSEIWKRASDIIQRLSIAIAAGEIDQLIAEAEDWTKDYSATPKHSICLTARERAYRLLDPPCPHDTVNPRARFECATCLEAEFSAAVAEERERILAVADKELCMMSCCCLQRLKAAIREASA